MPHRMSDQKQLNCVLDGYTLNGTEDASPKFSAKAYSSIYYGLITLIEVILGDAYHGPRLADQLARWAREGWYVFLVTYYCRD